MGVKYNTKNKMCGCVVCSNNISVRRCKCLQCLACSIHIGSGHEEEVSYKGLCSKCKI